MGDEENYNNIPLKKKIDEVESLNESKVGPFVNTPPLKKMKLSSHGFCVSDDEEAVKEVRETDDIEANPPHLIKEGLQVCSNLNRDRIQLSQNIPPVKKIKLSSGSVGKEKVVDGVQVIDDVGVDPSDLNEDQNQRLKKVMFNLNANEAQPANLNADKIQPANLSADKIQLAHSNADKVNPKCKLKPFRFEVDGLPPAPFNDIGQFVHVKRDNNGMVENWRANDQLGMNVEDQANVHPESKITDNCHICRDPMNKLCIKCRDDKEETGEHEKCILAWGKCKHAFHFHCFALWYDGNENCPICDTKWEFDMRKRHRLVGNIEYIGQIGQVDRVPFYMRPPRILGPQIIRR